MRFIRWVARRPGGELFIRAFDYTHDHPEAAVRTDLANLPSPVGVVVSAQREDTDIVFRGMGFGFATTVDALPDRAVISDARSVAEVVRELDDGALMVAVRMAVIDQGPAFAQRVNEVLAARSHVGNQPAPVAWFRPWTWEAWVWAMWLAIAMVCAGIGASIIALGPVFLGYDTDFLLASRAELESINEQLIPFLQHDRITMAGCMMAIGFNDLGFAFAMRRGWRWARAGFATAGAIGFPTFFLFLGYRFFDPLHFAVAVGFFPLYLGGVFGRPTRPSWRVPIEIDEHVRRRALLAQLMMVAIAVGVLLSGFLIMTIGLRDVLIPSDRTFLDGTQALLRAELDGRLLRFVAHDRAGFGGALASLGAGLLTTAMWGWRAGERSTYWLLGASSVAGFGAALWIHHDVGYTDVLHLLPVYVGIGWMVVVLHLSRDWFRTPTSELLPGGGEYIPEMLRTGLTTQ